MTLHHHIQKWLDFLNFQRRLSKHTLSAYQNDALHFAGFLQNHKGEAVQLSHLDALELKDFRAWLASRCDYDNRSNARALASIKSLWRYLLKQNLIKSEKIDLIKSPRIKKTLPRPLSQEQAEFLTKNIEFSHEKPWVGLRNKALITLLYATGLRISEALNLLQEDADKDVLLIKGKGSKERQVPLLDEAKQALHDYLHHCPYLGLKVPLFLGIRGGCMNPSDAATVLRNFRRSYNLPETLTPHALRHTCASHLMSASKDIRGIQTLLGHASLSSTQIYTDLDTERLLETYANAHPRAGERK